MPQKALKLMKGGTGKKVAANSHGRAGGKTKKGGKTIAPKRKHLLAQHVENTKITKIINCTNEENASQKATGAGGKLSVLKAPLKVDAPKGKKLGKTAEAAKLVEKNPFTL